MKKENFICPCCGLPNHLGFKYQDAYQVVRDNTQPASTDVSGNYEYIEIDENNATLIGQDLLKRFQKINTITNKFYNIEEERNKTYKEWFDSEVVCFIQGTIKKLIKYYWIHYYFITIEERYRMPKILKNIEEHTRVPEILKNIEEHTRTPEILKNIEQHFGYPSSLNTVEKRIHYNIQLVEWIAENVNPNLPNVNNTYIKIIENIFTYKIINDEITLINEETKEFNPQGGFQNG